MVQFPSVERVARRCSKVVSKINARKCSQSSKVAHPFMGAMNATRDEKTQEISTNQIFPRPAAANCIPVMCASEIQIPHYFLRAMRKVDVVHLDEEVFRQFNRLRF